MWSKPWSYKEGLVIGGITDNRYIAANDSGAINWDLFACQST